MTPARSKARVGRRYSNNERCLSVAAHFHRLALLVQVRQQVAKASGTHRRVRAWVGGNLGESGQRIAVERRQPFGQLDGALVGRSGSATTSAFSRLRAS